MLTIRAKELKSDADVALLSNLLDAMQGQPDAIKFKSLSVFPQFKAVMTFVDESIFDKIDAHVLQPAIQAKLRGLHSVMMEASDEFLQAGTFTFNVNEDCARIEEDERHRRVAYIRIELWKDEKYCAAQRKFERANLAMWRAWDEVIPETLVPKEEENALGRGGTFGFTRNLPAWRVDQGRIVCRRVER